MFRLKKTSVSLAGRLILALNGVVVVVTLLAGGWFYFDATHKEKARIEAKSRQVGIYLQGALNLPLWEIDDQAVKMIGQTLMEDQTLKAVTICLLSWKAQCKCSLTVLRHIFVSANAQNSSLISRQNGTR